MMGFGLTLSCLVKHVADNLTGWNLGPQRLFLPRQVRECVVLTAEARHLGGAQFLGPLLGSHWYVRLAVSGLLGRHWDLLL